MHVEGARADVMPMPPVGEDRAHAVYARTHAVLCKGARKCGKLLVKRAGCVNSPGNVEVNTKLLSGRIGK